VAAATAAAKAHLDRSRENKVLLMYSHSYGNGREAHPLPIITTLGIVVLGPPVKCQAW
jgi:hypothetical protein